MKSHEVIRNAVDEPGVKRVAAELRVSQALVYKWCEPPAEDGDMEQSGTRNPLDRVRDIYLLTKDIRLIRWICNEAGGFFVPNPVQEFHKTNEETIFNRTRAMMSEFSDMLDAVHDSMADDSSVDPGEADEIRQKWEELKATAEGFVIECERGHYHLRRK
jgi:Phage regulatory protein CII (CP76)